VRTDHFGGVLLFAAGAALTLPATLALAVAVGLAPAGLALHLTGCVVLYTAGLPGPLRHRLGRALAAAAAMAVVVVAAATTRELALGAAGLVATGRLWTRPPASARAGVGCLVGLALGLALAAGLSGPSVLDAALALWGFGLGLAASLGAATAEAPPSKERDAFDDARRALLRLLDDAA